MRSSGFRPTDGWRPEDYACGWCIWCRLLNNGGINYVGRTGSNRLNILVRSLNIEFGVCFEKIHGAKSGLRLSSKNIRFQEDLSKESKSI